MLTGKNATIIQHCAIFGTLKREVRSFEVFEPKPYAQYPVTISVFFKEPRKRLGRSFLITPDNRA
jgi:hypothetical protein